MRVHEFKNVPDALEMIANKAMMYFEERILKLSDNKFYDSICRSEEDYKEVNEFYLSERIPLPLINKESEVNIEEFFKEHIEAQLCRLSGEILELLKLCDENTKLQFEVLPYAYPYPSKIVTDENTGVSLRAMYGTTSPFAVNFSLKAALVLEFKIKLVKKLMEDS